ncbi:uncharacterized protein L199_003828 [Kwoniella botswanensis]|uniref:uncharacterized protein n=1 Tax=Kwoniella botswanensis TaxID=1268659 RepID=UPI00315DECA1
MSTQTSHDPRLGMEDLTDRFAGTNLHTPPPGYQKLSERHEGLERAWRQYKKEYSHFLKDHVNYYSPRRGNNRYRERSILRDPVVVPGSNEDIQTSITEYTDEHDQIQRQVDKIFRTQWGTTCISGYFKSSASSSCKIKGTKQESFKCENLIGCANIQVESHDLSHIEEFRPKEGSLMLTFDSLNSHLNKWRKTGTSRMVEDVRSDLKEACEYGCYQSKEGTISIYPITSDPLTINGLDACLRWVDRTTGTRMKLPIGAKITIHPMKLRRGTGS